MSGFQSDQPLPEKGSYEIEERPTYLLSRDEDCENTFHHTADLVSSFQYIFYKLPY